MTCAYENQGLACVRDQAQVAEAQRRRAAAGPSQAGRAQGSGVAGCLPAERPERGWQTAATIAINWRMERSWGKCPNSGEKKLSQTPPCSVQSRKDRTLEGSKLLRSQRDALDRADETRSAHLSAEAQDYAQNAQGA